METKTREEEQENNRNKTYAPDIYAETVRAACADAQAEAERIKEKARKDADAIINKDVECAAVIRQRAEDDADETEKNADEYAREVRDTALKESQIIKEEAEQEAANLKSVNSRLTEENENIKSEIEQNRKQFENWLSLLAKMPKKKILGHGTYTMNQEVYNSLMDAFEYHKKLANNTLTSDEDKKSIADELEKQRQITANMEQNIQRQVSQMVEAHKKDLYEKYESEIAKYRNLTENEKLYILNQAKKIAEKIVTRFASMEEQDKKRLILRTYNELNCDILKPDEPELLF